MVECVTFTMILIASPLYLFTVSRFFSVLRFSIVADQTHNCCVIRKINDVIGGEPGDGVMDDRTETEQQGTGDSLGSIQCSQRCENMDPVLSVASATRS